ncbi:ABC transporter permease [Zavarzinia aquatilis]|uniref:ABC transporter permease n=2 Tax=Zavarzinia aquatilis TaxID=2211142 RepID=A0A317EG85_9PROT|nr:ABC transporter permease [Zavarzinia aquatilis]
MDALLDNALLISVFVTMLRSATPLLLSSIGELAIQRAGIWNLGVEGTMLSAAFAAYAVVVATGSLPLATVAAVLVGALVGALTSMLTVALKLDQFVTGLAINLVASGLTLYLFRSNHAVFSAGNFTGFAPVAVPFLADIPVIGRIFFQQRLPTYLALALIPLAWFFLHRTRQGLELRVLGENPKVLQTRGIAVAPRLWLIIVAGSGLTGLGGAFLVLGLSDRFIPEITAGRGWLVVVALVAGNWSLFGTITAVFAFAALQAIASHAQVLNLPVPYQFLLALPYIASLATLMIFRSRSGQPAHLGLRDIGK